MPASRLGLAPAAALGALAVALTGASLVHGAGGTDEPAGASRPAPRAAATLGTREMILVNQVGFARGSARWRARELYRLLQNPIGASEVAPGDRARAVSGGLAALRRELHEHRVLTEELAHTRADRAVLNQSAAPSAQPMSPPSVPYLLPVPGPITTSFGPTRDPATGLWLFRPGIRLRARPGETVRAPADATVRRLAETPLRGHAVVLSHADGSVTIMDGLGPPAVTVGQTVRRGETIATVPAPARGATPAIDVELWRGPAPVDPAPLLRAR